MVARSDLSPGTVFAGDYEIVKPLGEGGMGAVYVARQRSTDALRALKLMHPDLVRSPALRDKFVQEARIGARIQSDHVAQVLAAGVDVLTGMPWIAMELLEGETLGERVDRLGALPWSEVQAIFGQMCHALAAAHRQSIVHRDLKPDNVFLATPRTIGIDVMVKLLDFGIAKVVAESTSSQTGVMGTPVYMAPEQYQGRNIGPHTDVWALGLIAYYLLTGKSYWRNADGTSTSGPAALMYEACMEELVPASARAAEAGSADRLPPGFDAWFARCVAREPRDRFPDAAEAIAGMRAMVGKGEASQVMGDPLAPAQVGEHGTVRIPQLQQVAAARTIPEAPIGEDDAGPPTPPRKRKKKRAHEAEVVAPLVPRYEPPKKPQKPDRSGFFIIAALGALVLGALVFAVVASRGTTTTGADAGVEAEGASGLAFSDDAPVPVSSRDPMWGDRAAPVTLVVFSDFQCPFCARLAGTFRELEARYGQKKLRVVWKHNPLPFHQQARPAAIAAEAVRRLGGSAAFWKFHDLAFESQRDLGAENIDAWAMQAGVDRGEFRKLLDASDVAAKVDADLAAGKAAGVRGTPSTFVNGIFLSGAQPIEKFTAVIDEQLEAARAAVAAGTPAEKVYVKLSTENQAKNPPPEKPADKPTAPAEDDTKVYTVPVGSSPVRGNPRARVTIVVFSDFQCPFCKRAADTVNQILRAYPNDVRFVWKNNPLPFHNRAEAAAEMALEARAQRGDDGFWAAHDKMFENQTKLEDQDLAGYAGDIGVSGPRVTLAISSRKHTAQIAADQALANELGATGTPTFFINGKKLVGAQPYEKFKAAIDAALGK